MESAFHNRLASIFCLILNPQNFTETLQIEIRDIMIALPLKTYAPCIWRTSASTLRTIASFVAAFLSLEKLRVILPSRVNGLDSAKSLHHFWPETRPDCAAKFTRLNAWGVESGGG